jgi:1-deoxy-D-xylulose-5-phosphate synthase
MEAAARLTEKGIEATVVNARFAKPLDAELIKELAGDIKRLVTVEENTLSGGFGNSVIDLLQQSGITDVKVKVIAIPDEFVEHGSQARLRAKYNLDAEGITGKVMELFSESRLKETRL